MTSNKYSIRYALKKDFDFFYKGEFLPYSAKAWVFCNKRNRIAIGGVWLMNRQNTVFIRLNNKGHFSKKEFWKAAVSVINELKKLNIPLVCFRDEEVLNSKKFLEKLGFSYFGILNNQEIYKL